MSGIRIIFVKSLQYRMTVQFIKNMYMEDKTKRNSHYNGDSVEAFTIYILVYQFETILPVGDK